MRVTFPDTIVDDVGRHRVPDPNTLKLAHELVDLYYQHGQMFSEHLPRVGAKDAVYFYLAAEKCLKEGVSPQAYVHRQLQGMAVTGKFYPRGINSDNLAKRVEQDDNWGVQKVRSYQCQLDVFEQRVRLYGPALLLRDTAQPFSPLVRAVLAHRYGVTDVRDTYLERARFEYQAMSVASEVFHDAVKGWLI